MDVWIVLAVGIVMALAGGLIGAQIAGRRAAGRSSEPIRILASSSEIEQQQEALNRMRESNLALTSKLHDLTQQHDSIVESMRKAHAVERAGFEEEQRRLKEQLARIAAAAKDGSLISADSFAPTQFDENDPANSALKPAAKPAPRSRR